MTAPALIAAITAAAAFAESEEPGVQIVAARSADLVDRWFVVEGRRKSFRRIYVVAVREAPLEPVVVEMIGGSRLNDEALIAFALQAIQGGQAVGGAPDDFVRGDRDQPGSPASVAGDGFPVDPRQVQPFPPKFTSRAGFAVFLQRMVDHHLTPEKSPPRGVVGFAGGIWPGTPSSALAGRFSGVWR